MVTPKEQIMSKDKPKGESKVERRTKISPADDLTKTSKSGDIELDEEELKRVAGGAVDAFMKQK
jgi:hypothetical protein